MATNVKAKKKKGTYDNPKLFIYATVSLAILIALIVVLSLIIYNSSNYVGKVSGKKIYNYEYEYYLFLELSELQADVDVEGLSDAEKEAKYKEFWSTPNENGEYPEDIAKRNALEEARKFKASYILATQKGFKLSKKEKTNIKNNIDYTLQMWMSYYSQLGLSISRADLIKDLCATMTLEQYKDYMVQYTAIQQYKESLKETYTVSDEEIKSIYEKDVDKYRFVDIRLLFMKAVDEDGEELSETEYAKLLEEANKIAKSFNDTGKYEDKDFKEYVKSNNDETSKEGFYTINKDEYEHKSKKINEYAYSLKREDFNNDGITEYKVIEDEDMKGIYVVRGEGIVDIDTPEPDKDEDSTTAEVKKSGKDIKDKIAAERKEEMAVEEIEQAVSGPAYAVSNKKEKIMKKYVDDWGLRKG